MMASASSNTALAMSVTSARVGIGASIMLSSMCVATITGLPRRRQVLTMRRWTMGNSKYGISIPKSPRATMMPSAPRTMDSKFNRACWSSILAMTNGCGLFSPNNSRSCKRSRASRTKDSAMKSTPSSRPSFTSRMSLAVSAGKLTLTPGRLMWRRLPSLPSVSTSHSTLLPFLASTYISIVPLSISTTSPTLISLMKFS